MHRFRPTSCLAAVLVSALLMSGPGTLWAASGEEQATAASSSQPQEPRRHPDFLFGPPHGSIGFRGSWVFASAGSDLFDFVTRQLTVDKNDFNAPGFGAEFNLGLTGRLDTQVGFQWNKTDTSSEYRDLVDNNFLPIQQSTSLKMWQLTGSLRYALTPRGHDVSRFAWVPRRVVPFVGAGGGVVRYEFQQSGDFVDFVDMSVFSDVFHSDGWTPSVHALGGVDVQVYRSVFGTVEARYTKASGKLGSEFIDFDPIDLSGLRIAAGINLLF